MVLKIIFLSDVGDGGKNFYALSPISLKIFYCRRRQRLKFFNAVADRALKCLAMSATALKSTKRKFSSLNHQNF